MRQILWNGSHAVATQQENGQWTIMTGEGQITVTDEEFQVEQNKVGEEMWSAWENADMSELEEDDYDYINNWVKVAEGR